MAVPSNLSALPTAHARAPVTSLRILLASLLTTVAFAAAPTAATKSHPMPSCPMSIGGHAENQFIAAWDVDGDGKVAKAEYEATRTQRFAATDVDGDATLSVDEYVNEYATRLDRQIAEKRQASIEQTHTRFKALDKDRDGFVTREQFDMQPAAFKTADTDADGKLNESEYVDEFTGRLDRQIARTRQAQLNQGRVRFESIDSDKSGGVNSEEYLIMSARMFERADTNQDRVVSKDDLTLHD